MRRAGSEDWHPVSDDEDLAAILSPESWWKVQVGDSTYTAPDFDTVVRWAREGRLTTDSEIEGPRTPPGGVLASGLPRLAPYLRELPSGSEAPPRLRIDGREYSPGDVETVREWIQASRVPPEAEISLSGGDWEPIGECGLFEPELWPEGAWGQPPEDEEPGEVSKAPVDAGEEDEETAGAEQAEAEDDEAEPREDPEEGAEGLPGFGPGDEDEPGEAADEEAPAEPYAIETLQGRLEAATPRRVAELVRKKQVRSFDRVLHPELPDGECSVSEFMEMKGLGRSYTWVWILIVVLLAAAAVIFFDPFGLGILQGGA